MAVQVSYPGIYIDEFAPGAPIESIGTSTAGFVGVALKGPIDTPTLVQSWDAYVEIFGGLITEAPTGFLAPAVFGFFLNGGTACYVLRVSKAAKASGPLLDREAVPKPVLTVHAIEEGAPGNALRVEVLNASLLATLLKQAGSPDTTVKPVFAKTAVSVAPVAAAPDTLEVAAVTGFVIGDRVHLQNGPDGDTAIIKAIDGKKLIFASPVGSKVFKIATDVHLENLAIGRKRFRVTVPAANFVLSQALPAGTTIHIDQAAPPLSEIAVVESAAGDTITLKTALKNNYDQTAAGSPAISSLEFTLRVDDGATTEEFTNLAMNPAHPNYWGSAVDSQFVTLAAVQPPPVIDDLRPKVVIPFALAGGKPDDRALAWKNFEAAPAATLDLFRPVDEIAIVAVPGSTAANVQQAVRDHCESLADRFGILDGVHDPAKLKTLTDSLVALKLQFAQVRSQRGYVALYYPWLTALNPVTGALEMLPPSGHVAGIYARTDQQRGVHKAPANTNIRGALGVERTLDRRSAGPAEPAGHQRPAGFPADGAADGLGRAHDRHRHELAVRQHPAPVPLPRGVDPGRHPLGGLRAEQPAALAEAEAHDHRVPDARLARRRAVRRNAEGGVLRAHRRGAQPSARARARPPAHRDRRPAGLPGRVHHRAHRHLGGRPEVSAKC